MQKDSAKKMLTVDIEPKSVAIITSYALSLVNFRSILIKSLISRGIRVYALAPDFDTSQREFVSSLGAHPIDFSLSRTGLNPIRDAIDTIQLALLLKRISPDVVLCCFIKPAVVGIIAAFFADVPLKIAMIEGLGFIFTDSGIQPSLKRKFLMLGVSLLCRVALTKSDKVIFLNRDDVREFTDRKIIALEKTSLIKGIGVDLTEWAVTSLPTSPVTFILIARLLREKGVLEYIEAARIVKKAFPSSRFILVGGTDANPGSLPIKLIRSWVDENLVEWPGHTAVKPWLAQASVFVLPSFREGVPRSTQEAMAMGRPVITTDVPGCRETVKHGFNGYLVPVRDVSALALRMVEFIKNPQLITQMGKASRVLAEEWFDGHRINLELLKILGVTPISR